nr:hypothetical protein [Rhodococcus sp. 06-1059B-a]
MADVHRAHLPGAGHRPGMGRRSARRPCRCDPKRRPAPDLAHQGGRERPEFIAGVDAFITAAAEAEAELDIIDVPEGTHGFDMFDDSPESRDAVTTAIEWVLTTTTRDLP